ncbi:hypothetical protein AXW37_09225 [Yersinia ruckeri]|nr:hypothetical protein UGYR_01340 [Yersinia ruckeri]AUQ43188.1 hypothetical protein NJ56_15475 [Yersinia ruckeri]OEU25543.1 hypothetical protein BI323_04415 [Yersinia ruckeri]OIX36842.1 hypothetical protein AXW19_08865 [Yersinia ruckeri]OIX37213.1 hypothetical protein AXW20_08885 [Yersinia ruckeri]
MLNISVKFIGVYFRLLLAFEWIANKNLMLVLLNMSMNLAGKWISQRNVGSRLTLPIEINIKKLA